MRHTIIKFGNVNNYESGYLLFEEGDYGDLMYVILSGSVNVRKNTFLDGKICSLVINSLYDGQHFGDFSMLQTIKGNFSQKKNDNFGKEKYGFIFFNFYFC